MRLPKRRKTRTWIIETKLRRSKAFIGKTRASRISAFLSIKYWSTGAIFGYLSYCAAAFGIRKQVLIPSTKAMMLITLSLVAALIARYPFVAAARSPL
jgi:hypothetical protein